MSDRIRQHLSTVVVALIVGALAGVTSSAVAQAPPQDAEQVFETAGFNADSVDGRHATKYTTTRGKRAGKLVATNANGYLPSNILKPQWRVIQNMPASFTDGQIGWYEVANKPGGFADNVDNAGVTKVKLTRVIASKSTVTPGGGWNNSTVFCPTGSILTGGGYEISGDVRINVFRSSAVGADAWSVRAWLPATASSATDYWATAVCMSTEPSGTITTAQKGVRPANVRIRR